MQKGSRNYENQRKKVVLGIHSKLGWQLHGEVANTEA